MLGRSTWRPGLLGMLLAAPLVWGLFRYGATEPRTYYFLFLILLLPALFALLHPGTRHLQEPCLLPLFLVGGFLLVQTALQPTLTAQGYLLASLGWLALFLALWISWRDLKTARVLYFLLILLGAGEAIYGLVQAIGGVDSIGNSYRGTDHLATGTLVNRNHFAGLLNMTMALALGGLFASFSRRSSGSHRRSEIYAWAWIMLLSCSFIGLAILLSQSRGGVLILMLTVSFVGVMLTLQRRRRLTTSLPGPAAWILLLTILGLGAWVGIDALVARFSEVAENVRLMVYRDTLKLMGDNPWLGVGPGMYRWRFRPYQTGDVQERYDHAHNDYLETGAEWGIPAALLFWSFVLWRFCGSTRAFLQSRDPWQQGVALGCSGAILSILVHSLVDFNLRVSTSLMIFCIVLGLAWSADRQSTETLPGIRSSASGIGSVQLTALRALLSLLVLAAGWKAFHQLTALHSAQAAPGVENVVERLERAIRWDPEGASYHFQLGLLRRDIIELQDLSKAQTHLETAVELNPHSWRHRLELARLYEIAGDQGAAESAFLEAVRLNPRSGTYRWRLSNFYVRSGDLTKAYPQLKAAMSLDRSYLRASSQLLARTGASAADIESVWPEDRESRLLLLRLLIDGIDAEGGPGLGDLRRQWKRILDDSEPMRIDEGAFFIRFLLRQGLYEEARRQWIELSRGNGIEDEAFEEKRNYVWNGNFENPISNVGLDWALSRSDAYSFSWRQHEGSGRRSILLIDFHGRNLHFDGLRQEAVVDAGEEYYFSVRACSQNITTDEGIFVEVVDLASGGVLLSTKQVLGTTPWKEYSDSFKIPPETHQVRIRLRRNVSPRIDNLLHGRLWLDSIVLRRLTR